MIDTTTSCYVGTLGKEDKGETVEMKGIKYDKDKPLAGILLDFSRSLKAVVDVGTFGAKKYSRGNWLNVENGIEKYTDAMVRHFLDEAANHIDKESGLSHLAHLAWNILAVLELTLRDKEKES